MAATCCGPWSLPQALPLEGDGQKKLAMTTQLMQVDGHLVVVLGWRS